VQALCVVEGQTGLQVDGSFGPATLAAVRLVQQKYLPYDQIDGVVGPVTWSLLLVHRVP
jgi:peptidoglycan hydrolase-like protein with peptidoglycan-binding domain